MHQDRVRASFAHCFTLLRVPLLASLAAVWIGSGVASLLVTSGQADLLLTKIGLVGSASLAVTRAGAVLDLVLGLAMLPRRYRTPVLAAQFVVVGCYTLLASLALPGLWLDPFGALLKNLPVMLVTMVLLAMERAP